MELDFHTSRELIEKELEKYFKNTIEIPHITYEKGEIKISFFLEFLSKDQIFDVLVILKQYLENIRIHTMDANYAIFQSMGPNLFETKNFLSGIKFKFINFGNAKVEITKANHLVQEEIQAIIEVFKYFFSKKKKFNFLERYAQLGVRIYSHHSLIANEEEKKYINPIEEDWDQLGGYEDIKQEIQETVILPLKFPDIFLKVSELTRGEKITNYPSAVLFEGPPGVGKTSMARIIASESKVPMLYIPIENILSKYYGESAKNLSEIFDLAKNFQKVILFLDEIDSLAGSREEGMIEATRRILSVLLRKIDGFENNQKTLTIGATNRMEDLDHALISRFDAIIHFPMPNLEERKKIFQRYIKHLKEEELYELAKLSDGFSGRNIKDTCEMAERKWARYLIIEKKAIVPPPIEIYKEIIIKKSKNF